MPAQLTTHVLDTSRGTPAAGLRIDLWRISRISDAEEETLLKTVTTNADGRSDEPLLAEGTMLEGRYLLLFHVADYFAAQHVTLPDPPFLDIVPVRFAIFDASAKYHVPLLVSPWAYSTYRGS
jgi:5-hydroxyisourate hydrolase